MQFNSIDFMLFFPIVLIFYFIIPKKTRTVWLLFSSYYFYMSWNPKYAALIAGTTLVTWISGIAIGRVKKRNSKEGKIVQIIVLVLCLLFNLSILAVFKYGNFVLESFDNILLVVGISVVHRRFDILLPVGISFYTFQALGYIIDVYKDEADVETNLIRYALFVSFFPQLVAGPIERSKNLLTQVKRISDINLWNSKRIVSGTIQMIWGYFMKMVIADRMAILVDTIFNEYRMFGSTELVIATLGFTVQIYCDFASYSLIAIGASRILGINLMENFDAPYFARNIKDFWNRWHISLSTWFKDYLYIPLGGSRKGKLCKCINLMIVFLVSGLWHGANWTFLIWGGVHGLYRVAGELSLPYRKKLLKQFGVNTNCFSWKLLETICTFFAVAFAWIFFRSDSLYDSFRFIKRIFVKPTPWLLFNGGIYNLGLDRTEMNILVFSMILLIMVDLVKITRKKLIDEFLMEQNVWFEWVVIIGFVWMIFVFGEYGPTFDAQQFIYFQF